MALYIPHSIFPFGAAFVCQAGNFWTLLLSCDINLQVEYSEKNLRQCHLHYKSYTDDHAIQSASAFMQAIKHL